MSFISTHKLDFLSGHWENPFNSEGWQAFKIGTVNGLWVATENTYDILVLINSEPGNGHFEDVFDWFENSCKRDNKDLRILELMNEELGLHLVSKRGFTYYTKVDLIKRFRK